MQPELSRVIEQVSKEKGIDKSIVVQAVETAMLSAAKKVIGGDMRIEAQFNSELGEVELFKILTVVETVTNPELEISIESATSGTGGSRRRPPSRTSFSGCATPSATSSSTSSRTARAN
jgi:hypothetical protein